MDLEGRTSFVNLFCGAGGLTWGWVRAGFLPLACVDNDVAALRTHELNFGDQHTLILQRDLATFRPRRLVDMLGRPQRGLLAVIGGPPCQGWSKVGRGKIRSLKAAAHGMLNDPRNRLYRNFLQYVDVLRPPLSMMENVPGMLSIEGRNVADLIVTHFGNIGYECSYHLVNARWFGIPQNRERLIFIARRRDIPITIDVRDIEGFARAFSEKHLGLVGDVTVGEAIGDLPRIVNGALEDPRPFPRVTRVASRYCAIMRAASNGTLTDHVCRDNPQDVEAFQTMKQGMKYYQLASKFKRYRDDIFPDKYKKLYWNRPSWTVTAHLAKDCYTHIHPRQARTLSIREAARLQSFPDDFRFFGNIGDRFRQIGNAVPPLMAWGIAEFVKMRIKRGVRK